MCPARLGRQRFLGCATFGIRRRSGFAPSGSWRSYALLSRRRSPSTESPLRRLPQWLHHPSPHLLHLSADLFLNAEVACALNWREKLAQLTLFRFGQVDTLTLDLELFRDQLLDPTDIRRVVLQHLGAQRTPRHHLATVHVPTLGIEALIHLAQLTHPIVAQPELRLEQSREPHTKALLELLSIDTTFALAIYAATLTSALRVAHRKR